MTSDKELIEMVVNPNLLEEEYIYKAMQYHVQTHPSVHFDGNTFKNIDNGRDAYSKSFIEDFLKQCEEFPPSHDDHCYSPPVDWIWDDPLSTITSNTLSIGGRIKGKGDLISLHSEYRSQHEAMCDQGKIYNTTRRQANFRPRGKVYQRLLKLELKWY